MRVCDSLLTRQGRAGVLVTAVKISIGDIIFYNNDTGMETCRNTDTGQEWTAIGGNRIVLVDTFERPYGGTINQKSKIVFNNNDNVLTDMNFKGKRVSIGWGAETTKGRLYDVQPPFYVSSQIKSESEGTKIVTLTLLGLTDWLGQDKAQCDYISTGTDTIYDLFVKVMAASIPPFEGCKAFNVIIDMAFDGVFDLVIPGPSFKITKDKDTRATVLARLFDMTYVKMRTGCEDLINGLDSVHLLVPTSSVTNTFSLDETDHKYFLESEYSQIFAPNDIVVKNPNNETAHYTGRAKDLISYQAIPSTKTEYISGLVSDAQAILVASTILQNLKTYYNGFSAKVPMFFGQELFDKPELKSPRTGKTVTGTLGTIERVYNPRKSEPQFYMTIQAGKWFDPRGSWDVMGIGAGYVDTSEDNKYQTILVPCFAYDSQLGTWAQITQWASVGVDGNGDWIKYMVKIPAGDYYLRTQICKARGCGIEKIYLDDVLAITRDCYNAGASYEYLNEAVTIVASTSDWHELKFMVDGKNVSSSGYGLVVTDTVFKPY